MVSSAYKNVNSLVGYSNSQTTYKTLNELFGDFFKEIPMAQKQNFPPYNISVDSDENPSKAFLEIATAGFSKDELSVKVTEDSSGRKLVVSGKKQTDDSKSTFYRVKGLSNHSFKRVFNLASSTVHAISYVDGILKIEVLFQNEQQETSFKIN